MQNQILKSIESYLGYSFKDYKLQNLLNPQEVASNEALLRALQDSFKNYTNTILYLNTDDCLAQVYNLYNYPGEALFEALEMADIILTDGTSPAHKAHALFILKD